MTTQDHPPANHPFGFDTGLGDPSPPTPTAQAASDSASQDSLSPSDRMWAEIRQQYLRGVTAAACARQFGVGLSTLRERAALNGWRRKDAIRRVPDRIEPPFVGAPASVLGRLDPWDEGAQLEEEHGGTIQGIEPHQLRYVAACRMTRAVLRGDAMEALRWRKVRDAMDEDQEEYERFIHAEEVREFNSQIHYPAAPIAPDWHLDDTDLGDPDAPDRMAFIEMGPTAEPEPAPAPDASPAPDHPDSPDSPDPVSDRPDGGGGTDPATSDPDFPDSPDSVFDRPDAAAPDQPEHALFPDPCSPFPPLAPP